MCRSLLRRGFSLLEIMLAVGALGLVSIGTMKLMHDGQVGYQQLENRVEAMQLQNLATSVLKNKSACFETFKNKKIGDSVYSIVDENNKVFWSSSSGQIGDSKVSFREIKLESVGVAISTTLKKVNASIIFTKSGSSARVGSAEFAVELPLLMELDSGNNVKECYTDNENTIQAAVDQIKETICNDHLGATWSDATKTCTPSLGTSINSKLDVTGNKTLKITNPIAIKASGSVKTGTLSSGSLNSSSITSSGAIQGGTITATSSLKTNGVLSAASVTSTGAVSASTIKTSAVTTKFATSTINTSIKNIKLPGCPSSTPRRVFRSDGSTICTSQIKCTAGAYVAGFQADGSPKCISLFAPSSTVKCSDTEGLKLTTDSTGKLKLVCVSI